ncbi:MAG: Rne/Rng family ribonuclease [Bdellovibrionota bacterium]
MATELIINATLPETRIALLEEGEIQELHIERDSERGIVGNIYKGKVIRVLPGMQAAFVDIGLEKAAFLYVDDIFFPDMENPLQTQPLPEAQPKAVAVQAKAEGPLPLPLAKQARGRGRFGRGRDTRVPALPPTPGSPEDHAQLQREYAKQMLDIEEEFEAPVPGQAGQADSQATPSAEGSAVDAQEAAGSAEGRPVQTEGTPSVAPEGDEETLADPTLEADFLDADGEEQKEEDVEAGVIYRPEPIIDADAWAEEVARAHTKAVVAATGAEPGAEVIPAETVEAVVPEVIVAPKVVEVVAVPQVARQVPVEDDDDEVSEMPRRRKRRESLNIADIVKEGQEILVQVAKDPIGTKGARLTCHVSLPGRYLVFMPTVDHIGVSRRIESEIERRRLKETMSKVRPAKTGVIVRTASGKQTDRKLKADLDYLVTTWNDIQRKFKKQKCPSPVYQDLTIVLRAIRDMFTDEVDKVVVDSKREHRAIMKFVTRFIPNVKSKVELYVGDMPIFDAFGIETEISRAMERKVWLKSGGYLVIDQAEALVAIDVNTGRYVGKKTLEETILKTNLEAVKEIAYQLRLRNCGGIIILDLIDMEKEANRDKVFKALEEELKKDRARPTIMKISQLGLIEMTRKRTRDSMVRSLCEPCSYCEGKGYVKNKLTIAYDIMRDLEREGIEKDTQAISIQCHPSVADVLLEDKRDVLEDLERQFSKKITIRGNGAYHVEQYELVSHRESKNQVWSSEERRQIIRTRIQERQQQLAQEQRKQADAQRQERKRENEERRKQQDTLRQERKAQSEEKRRLAAEQRRERQAAVQTEASENRDEAPPEDREGFDAETSMDQPAAGVNVQTAASGGRSDFYDEEDEPQPLVNPDGTPIVGAGQPRVPRPNIPKPLNREMRPNRHPRGDRQDASAAGGPDRNRRRRRGRRGRGGRPGQPEAGGGRHPHPRPNQGFRPQQGPAVRPNGDRAVLPQRRPEELYSEPSSADSEHLRPDELAGSVVGAEGEEGARPAGGAPRQPRDPRDRDDNQRRRRRGRRGGRRFRFRKRPEGEAGEGPQSQGAEGEPRNDSAPEKSGPSYNEAPHSFGLRDPRSSGGDDEGQ